MFLIIDNQIKLSMNNVIILENCNTEKLLCVGKTWFFSLDKPLGDI